MVLRYDGSTVVPQYHKYRCTTATVLSLFVFISLFRYICGIVVPWYRQHYSLAVKARWPTDLVLPCSINRHNDNNYNLFGSIIALSVILLQYSDVILERSTWGCWRRCHGFAYPSDTCATRRRLQGRMYGCHIRCNFSPQLTLKETPLASETLWIPNFRLINYMCAAYISHSVNFS